MSSPFRKSILAAALIAAAVTVVSVESSVVGAESARRELRVCADPNNLPFSNQRREGFENRLAEVIARDMNATLSYVWWSQRRGFVRNTLNAGDCDVVMGVPTSLDLVLRTRPYYRSTYMFVTRPGLEPIRTFDDPRLRTLRVGVQLVGDDGANSPPAHALSKRGIIENVRGYMVYGDYATSAPLAPIIRAVREGEVDVAVVWGPIAGYFAGADSAADLSLTPVSPQIELPFLPFVFDIAMGVRRGDSTLRNELDAVIERRRADIDSLLDAYRIPRVGAARRS